MDKQLISKQFSKAISTYDHQAFIQHQIAHRMLLLMQKAGIPTQARIVEFGCGTGYFSRLLIDTFRPSSLLINDLSPTMYQAVAPLLSPTVSFKAFDAETANFPTETQILCSCSALQWFNSPATFFARSVNCLSKDGYLVFSTFGPNNFQELKALTGRGLHYYSRNILEDALRLYYDICLSTEEVLVQHFETPLSLFRHLKETGVNGIADQPLSPAKFAQLCTNYQKLYSNSNGGVNLTYHPIYIIAQKRK